LRERKGQERLSVRILVQRGGVGAEKSQPRKKEGFLCASSFSFVEKKKQRGEAVRSLEPKELCYYPTRMYPKEGSAGRVSVFPPDREGKKRERLS